MSTVAKVIGYCYLLAWTLSFFNLVDVYVCIGKPGSCFVQPAKTIDTPREKSV